MGTLNAIREGVVVLAVVGCVCVGAWEMAYGVSADSEQGELSIIENSGIYTSVDAPATRSQANYHR